MGKQAHLLLLGGCGGHGLWARPGPIRDAAQALVQDHRRRQMRLSCLYFPMKTPLASCKNSPNAKVHPQENT